MEYKYTNTDKIFIVWSRIKQRPNCSCLTKPTFFQRPVKKTHVLITLNVIQANWATKKTSYVPWYWLFNRDPYFMVYFNPHIAGQKNSLYIYTLNNRLGPFFIAQFKTCLLGCLGYIWSFSLHFFLHFCHGAKKSWCFLCGSFSWEKRTSQMHNTQHVVKRTQNNVALLWTAINVRLCVCVRVVCGSLGHLFVICPSSIDFRHLWTAMWCFRPMTSSILLNLP